MLDLLRVFGGRNGDSLFGIVVIAGAGALGKIANKCGPFRSEIENPSVFWVNIVDFFGRFWQKLSHFRRSWLDPGKDSLMRFGEGFQGR